MKRTDFLKTMTAGSVGAAIFGPDHAKATTLPTPPKKVLMKVGCQSGGTSVENLEFKARHGVFNIDGGSPKIIPGKGWDLEDSLAKRDACEKYGISLDAYHYPLTSAGIDRVAYPNIMLGKSPERDREIEYLQQMIQVAGKTGIKVLNYNTTILPVLRTGKYTDPKRGNAEYSVWNYEEALKRNDPKTVAGDVSVDQIFERITYLLDRILPVAKEYKVKLANHIADPPVSAAYRGVMRWNSPDVFKGIQRFAKLYDSEYHGFNFCIGSIAEGLKDPKNDIYPIIKWVGERNQIFNVHLRNIKGNFNNFQEVYPDNGEMNFAQVVRALRDVGYAGMVMPDHVPHHHDPAASLQAFSFCYGYIKGLLQTVSEEV
ncbi:mannonate dehydratase [Runella aurantiaca]|uniref:mannonate dehydratase n=1 Tax=Runella aurantiaca TaxID=2282308 RepID=A0A369ICL1_9BACT|nr:mannonate dehydratase [Runella aurantiaca]RDB05233.1 mannonate dehydratase [Runella aurantiaca]